MLRDMVLSFISCLGPCKPLCGANAKCVSTPEGPKCKCNDGYAFDSDMNCVRSK